MPVVAIPATPIIVTRDEVRRFMRDYPDKNILLDDVEFSQQDVDQAADFIVSAYNVTTPLSSITLEGWPAGHKYLLLLGIAWYLVKSGTFLQKRNQLTYQDGDIAPIGIDDKFSLYMSLWQTLKQEWDMMVKESKIQMNLERCYGYVSSGYRTVARYHQT
jgi:hypothetical protein